MAANQRAPQVHRVRMDVAFNRQIFYDQETILARPGDTIEWSLDKDLPFGIIIKAVISPLDAGSYTAQAGNTIQAVVREDASPGYYPYAMTVSNGQEIIVVDPEIIVRPPKGG